MTSSTKSSNSNLEGKMFRKIAPQIDEVELYPHAHAERIATLAAEIAKAFVLGPKDLQSLRAAALLHDLGELVMDRDYLKRSGPLSANERLDLQRHALIGEQESARSGGDRATQLIIRWHHEWWNGQGYPDALRREEIPLAARILRVADSYAALTDARPFRAALSKEKAREHLVEWAGIEFDPKVVDALLMLGPLVELDSFSLVEGDEPRAELPAAREFNLFSSFMK